MDSSCKFHYCCLKTHNSFTDYACCKAKRVALMLKWCEPHSLHPIFFAHNFIAIRARSPWVLTWHLFALTAPRKIWSWQRIRNRQYSQPVSPHCVFWRPKPESFRAVPPGARVPQAGVRSGHFRGWAKWAGITARNVTTARAFPG